MNSSTITLIRSPRIPVTAYSQAFAASDVLVIIDWPLPLELMTGLTTQGRPILLISFRSSCSDEAYAYRAVRSPSSVSYTHLTLPTKA